MNDIQKYRDLLHEAARLYERWRANRPKPFNVFTALRTASDEVNLHSRFLYALLDHVDPISRRRENLKAFLREVIGARDFSLEHAEVERERNHIDLLISNENHAVIIENKIWSGDGMLQLQGYRNDLIGRGYKDDQIRIVYLTPYGHRPDRKSLGEIPNEKVLPVSYDGDKLQGWLIDCQRRAFNEPGLRESIAQYIHLIRRMTNTDQGSEHMSELTELLMRNDNLVLARQLSRARVSALAVLVRKFYDEVDRKLHEKIEDLPEIDPDYLQLMEEKAIKNCITGKRNSDSGLYYRIDEYAWLAVVGYDRFWFGISCHKKDDLKLHERLIEVLADVHGGRTPDHSAPWWMWVDDLPAWNPPKEWFHLRRDSNVPSLKFLSGDEGDRAEIVQGIADSLACLWKKIKEHGIAD